MTMQLQCEFLSGLSVSYRYDDFDVEQIDLSVTVQPVSLQPVREDVERWVFLEPS